MFLLLLLCCTYHATSLCQRTLEQSKVMFHLIQFSFPFIPFTFHFISYFLTPSWSPFLLPHSLFDISFSQKNMKDRLVMLFFLSSSSSGRNASFKISRLISKQFTYTHIHYTLCDVRVSNVFIYAYAYIKILVASVRSFVRPFVRSSVRPYP